MNELRTTTITPRTATTNKTLLLHIDQVLNDYSDVISKDVNNTPERGKKTN